eukprot:SAG11_NODE_3172_length_2635_cov_2.232650_2_plen_43_part_00
MLRAIQDLRIKIVTQDLIQTLQRSFLWRQWKQIRAAYDGVVG